MLPPFQIRTARLLLRALEESDRAEFVRCHAVNNDHFGPWWPAPPPGQTDEQLFEAQLARAAEERERGTAVRLVGFADDGRMAALVNLSQIFRGPFENAYAGWSVSVECAGRGIATEAVTALLDLAFAPAPGGVGLHRVQANIMPSNARSVRVAEKCGFRREGLAKDYLKIAGAWQDHYMYAKLAEEHSGKGGG